MKDSKRKIIAAGSISLIFSFLLFFTSYSAAGDNGTTCPDFQIEVSKGLINIDVREADLVCLLRDISYKSGISVTSGPEVTGTVTIRAVDAPLEEVLKKICANRAMVFKYNEETGGYRILRFVAFETKKNSEKPDVEVIMRDNDNASHAKESPALPVFADSGSDLHTEPEMQSAGPVSPQPLDSKGRPLFKDRELIIEFKETITEEQIEALHRRVGILSAKKIFHGKFQNIVIPYGGSEEAVMEEYRRSDIVRFVERNALRYPLSTVPDDFRYPEQWAPPKISLPEAWDITLGIPDVLVAVIDTGVNYLHPDLSPNIWINTAEAEGLAGIDDDGNGYIDDIYGWDFADNDSNPASPSALTEYYEHGTHVAGIIAAKGNNGTGITGVAPHIRILPLKVLAENSSSIATSDVLMAYEYARNAGARIINCSFGGSEENNAEYEAISALKTAGILIVCAAGNDGTTALEYPAGYDLENIISVAWSKSDDTLSPSSNFGLPDVDLMAPGNNILSTVPNFSGYTEASLTVFFHDGTETACGALPLEYGAVTENGGLGGPLYDCGLGYPEDFPSNISGYIALIERGILYFSEKTTNALDRGASAVVIYNNEPGNFDGTLGSASTAWPPVIAVSRESGLALKSAMADDPFPPSAAVYNIVSDSPSSYGLLSGTSMAAPHVTGVAGLILSIRPDLRYDEVKSAILDTVDRFDTLSDKLVSGGRVNAFAALKSVLDTTGDISGNGMPGLEDAILALSVATGSTSSEIRTDYAGSEDDIGQSGKIGLEDALYILQKSAGVR
ncbi:MAG: S8 family serine peptidase [Syntrophales bacterium]|nr:S8 family serine peptidase [Syntrophales bacterium]MDY0044337.1 S8 family serine peptidase [Syntrophales bacterium]